MSTDRVLSPEQGWEIPTPPTSSPVSRGEIPTAPAPGAADARAFPAKNTPRWWVLWCLNAATAWDQLATTRSLHVSTAGQMTYEQLILALADLVHEGRIEVANSEDEAWALTDAGVAEWREQWC